MSDSVFTFTGETIVVLSHQAWGGPSTDPASALAARVARRNTVVFVEPAPGLRDAVGRVRRRRQSLAGAVAPGGSMKALHDRPSWGIDPLPAASPILPGGAVHRTGRLSPSSHADAASTGPPVAARGDGFAGPPPASPARRTAASSGAGAPAGPSAGPPTGRLYRVRPRFVPQVEAYVPQMVSQMLQRARCRSAVRAVRAACATLGAHRPIVLAASAPAVGLGVARALSPRLLAYYACGDETCGGETWGELSGDPGAYLVGEPDLLGAADLVVAATDAAYHRCARFHADPHLVRFGIQLDRYRPGALANPPGPRPCIGYLGPIDASVDIELVCRLSLAHPGCDLLFVGPIRCSATADALDAHANVTLLGARSPQETPVWLRTMDVCLVPLRPSAPERVVYQQVHAYFAAGKPVVVPPGQAPAGSEDLVDAMTSRSDTAAVLRALRHNTPARRRHRIEAARDADWSRRVHQITTLLRLHLRTPPVPRSSAVRR